jgi:Tfp pilus assembly protein PilO
MKLDSATQRIGLVTAAAALLLVVVWYFVLWSPEGHKLTAANTAHTAAEAQVSKLQSQVAGLQILLRGIPSDQQKLAQYKQAVPDNPELSSALDQIQAAAIHAGINISSISPGGAPAGAAGKASQGVNGVPAITVSISFTGSYQGVMSFITALDSMNRTLVVTSTSLSGGSGSANAQMSASISSDIFYAGQPTP